VAVLPSTLGFIYTLLAIGYTDLALTLSLGVWDMPPSA
jgi:hypothetical protein